MVFCFKKGYAAQTTTLNNLGHSPRPRKSSWYC